MSLSAVAVVGAGPRALSIAEAIAEADLPVTVVCITPMRRELACLRLERTLAMRVDVGELNAKEAREILGRITVTRDLSKVGGCDLVIESAVGDVRMRRALLATVEAQVSRGSVLASSAPQADLESMAEVLERKDQFLGLRFFHPASHTPLVALAPLPDTAPGAIAACETFCRWLRKTPVSGVEGAVSPVLRPKIRAVG